MKILDKNELVKKILEEFALSEPEIRAIYKGIGMEDFDLKNNGELEETPMPHYYLIIDIMSRINRIFKINQLKKRIRKYTQNGECEISEWPISPALKNPEACYQFLGEPIWQR